MKTQKATEKHRDRDYNREFFRSTVPPVFLIAPCPFISARGERNTETGHDRARHMATEKATVR